MVLYTYHQSGGNRNETGSSISAYLEGVGTDVYYSFVRVLHAERVRPPRSKPPNLLLAVEASPSLSQERYPWSTKPTHTGVANRRAEIFRSSGV